MVYITLLTHWLFRSQWIYGIIVAWLALSYMDCSVIPLAQWMGELGECQFVLWSSRTHESRHKAPRGNKSFHWFIYRYKAPRGGNPCHLLIHKLNKFEHVWGCMVRSNVSWVMVTRDPDPTPLHRHTGLKILPSGNFVGGRQLTWEEEKVRFKSIRIVCVTELHF